MLGLYRDNGKENGSYYIIGFYRDNIEAGVGSGGILTYAVKYSAVIHSHKCFSNLLGQSMPRSIARSIPSVLVGRHSIFKLSQYCMMCLSE